MNAQSAVDELVLLHPAEAGKGAGHHLHLQVITTTRGQTLSGLLVEETAEAVTVRDANGKDIRVAKRDIEERGKAQESIMPANLVAYFTEEELVDLVEYLTLLRTASLTPGRLRIIGPFDNGEADAGFDKEFPSGQRPGSRLVPGGPCGERRGSGRPTGAGSR